MTRSRGVQVLVAVGLLLAARPGRAAEITLDRAQYYSPRFFGMGGAFSALSDDRNLFFTNPAGLAYVNRDQIGFDLLPVQANTNTYDVANFFADNQDTFDNFDNLSDEEQAKFYDDLLADIGGQVSVVSAHLPLYVLLPSSSAASRPHLGFGIFARGGSEALAVSGASGIPIASLDLDVEITALVTAGYTWAELLPGRLSAAGSVKFDHRRVSLNQRSLASVSPDETLDFLNGTVAGLDLGLLYEATPTIRVSAAVFDVVSGDFEFGGQNSSEPQDAVNEKDVGTIESSLVLGGAYFAPRPYGPFRDLVVTLDLNQPFDEEREFWRSIHIGGEALLGPLALRFGFFEGYPGGGFGIGPLQYAYYSTELGHFPGAKSNYTHALSLAFSFGI